MKLAKLTGMKLINRATGKAWRALLQLYDVNVLLPPALVVRKFGDKDAFNGNAAFSSDAN